MFARRLLALTVACTAFATLTAGAQAQSQGTWVMKAPLPASLSEVSVAYVDGKVHVMGGSVLGFTGPYHVAYDPATDKWAVRAPMPRGLDHMGTTVLNGKVYLIGGFIGGGVHRDGQNTAFEYDPKLDSWRVLAPMKAGRGSVGAVAIDGKIHAIGGRDPAGTTVTTHEILRSGDQQLEGRRAAAEGARPPRRRRARRQDPHRRRPLRRLDRQDRPARCL